MKTRASSDNLEPETPSSELNAEEGEIAEVTNEEKPNAVIVEVQKNENNANDYSRILKLFPPVYRFCPTDGELIEFYLSKKVLNQPLPPNQIYDVNLYNYSPQDLARHCKPWSEHEWYFFTPRDRKYPKGQRPNRSARGGYWMATGGDKKIYGGDGSEIGVRKSLVFYKGKALRGSKTDWIMHEFKIGPEENTSPRTDGNMKLDHCVLCRIYEKKKKEKSQDNVKEKGKSVRDNASASQPSSQVLNGDGRTETPVSPFPSQSTEPVNLPGSNHTDESTQLVNFPGSYHTDQSTQLVSLPCSYHTDQSTQLSFSRYYPEDNRDFSYVHNMNYCTPIDSFGNPAFGHQFGFQSETERNYEDDFAIFNESFNRQSQYGFMESRQLSFNNFSRRAKNDIPPPAGWCNTCTATGWKNISPATFNSIELPPADYFLDPAPIIERNFEYMDQENGIEGQSVRETGYMDQNNGMQGGTASKKAKKF